MTPWPRIIAHADMDAFYAAVEQLDDPSLRGKPLLVGPRSGRGVVLTASYEARPFGVGSAMPMAQARKLCPDAIIVPPRFDRYTEISAQVMRVFGDFSPQVEAISLDEAFIDLSGTERLFGTPLQMARAIKEAVRKETGLTVSVGVSATKYVAKVASAFAKPDALNVVPPDEVQAWLAPLDVNRLWGVGPRTEARLKQAGIHVIGDLAKASPEQLQRWFGNMAPRFRALALGEDPRAVATHRRARSMSADQTLEKDISDPEQIRLYLHRSCDRIARRLRTKGLLAQGVRIKLRTNKFLTVSHQLALETPTDVSDEMFRIACRLLQDIHTQGPLRLVGAAAYGLQAASRVGEQMGLFDTARPRRLEQAVDAVASKFGKTALIRANGLAKNQSLLRDAPTLDFLD